MTARSPELRQTAEADDVPALAATVPRQQKELKELLDQDIPKTLRPIREATAHGDLSENLDYHSARARHELLSPKPSEPRANLGKVRVIDPSKIDASKGRVGTRVWLVPRGGGALRAMVVLGPYEANPEKGIASRGSEAAQAKSLASLGRREASRARLQLPEWPLGRLAPERALSGGR
ncbi:MAG TPA: hypothetical protein VMT45_07535 [Thermoanaerobaculaceae bacterium]|nr:hypothetical protein [Thermoanaerobaculaceae bacterium]